jgi:hypothetical protein
MVDLCGDESKIGNLPVCQVINRLPNNKEPPFFLGGSLCNEYNQIMDRDNEME